MKEIIVKDKTYLFVEIPDDATDFKLRIDNNIFYRLKFEDKFLSTYNGSTTTSDFLNRYDTVEIISTTKDISEEQAKTIVEKHPNLFYRDYNFKTYLDENWTKNWVSNTAKESLQSLLQANGLDVNKNYLILEKL